MFIDTHCHLFHEYYEDLDSIVKKIESNGIKKVIVNGTNGEDNKEVLDLISKYDLMYGAIGLHPEFADSVTDKDLEFVEKHLNDEKVVAIGEIGLDYHYGKENKDKQIELFEKQLALAEKYNKPVIIHSRDATEDTISILKEFPNVIGDIHCFSGSIETAKIYISMGYKIGIGGVVTFKNSNLFKVVEAIGIDSIILETDAPYLTPAPYRGQVNSSKYIPIIVEKVAEILDILVEKVVEITDKNAIRLFDLK